MNSLTTILLVKSVATRIKVNLHLYTGMAALDGEQNVGISGPHYD